MICANCGRQNPVQMEYLFPALTAQSKGNPSPPYPLPVILYSTLYQPSPAVHVCSAPPVDLGNKSTVRDTACAHRYRSVFGRAMPTKTCCQALPSCSIIAFPLQFPSTTILDAGGRRRGRSQIPYSVENSRHMRISQQASCASVVCLPANAPPPRKQNGLAT